MLWFGNDKFLKPILKQNVLIKISRRLFGTKAEEVEICCSKIRKIGYLNTALNYFCDVILLGMASKDKENQFVVKSTFRLYLSILQDNPR